MPHPRSPVDCDDSRPVRRPEQNAPPREWEPEPMHLPIEGPRWRPPVSIDPSGDEPSPGSRVIVIDLA